jgi:transcriptional regulator with XRE-family HTH domain
LDERRHAHYAGGRREPDLETLVDIARALTVSPNWLLGVDNEARRTTKRGALLDRLVSAAQRVSDEELRVLTVQAEALLRNR